MLNHILDIMSYIEYWDITQILSHTLDINSHFRYQVKHGIFLYFIYKGVPWILSHIRWLLVIVWILSHTFDINKW